MRRTGSQRMFVSPSTVVRRQPKCSKRWMASRPSTHSFRNRTACPSRRPRNPSATQLEKGNGNVILEDGGKGLVCNRACGDTLGRTVSENLSSAGTNHYRRRVARPLLRDWQVAGLVADTFFHPGRHLHPSE